MKKILYILFALILFNKGFATEIKSGDKVTITQPVHEDIYITGGTVVINAPIYGDLIVAGGTITLNDSVAFDVIAAGGEIFVNGYVGDDIRIAGGRLHISGNVGGDVVIAGGTISIDKSVIIHGSMLAASGEVIVDGTIMQQLKSGAGKFTLNGTVQKDVDCRGGELKINGHILGKSMLAADKIEIGENAEFHNDIQYWNKSGSIDFQKSIKKGLANYDPTLQIKSGRWHYLGFTTALAVLWYLGAALVVILILEYLFSATLRKAATTVLNQSLQSLGFGALLAVALPVAMIISFITVIGVPVGLIILFAYLILLMLATAITSVVIANWINNVYFSGSWEILKLSFASFGIFILLKLFSLTPFVGFPITVLMVCMAWGGILLNVKWKKNLAVSTQV
jgi:cytoskeletal protein CcmA (bactofilin family)